MIKKVIFLTDNPFNYRDYKMFGCEILESEGFAVEAWDCSPVVYPEVSQKYVPPDKFTFERLRVFQREKAVLNAIRGIRADTAVLIYLDFTWKHRNIFSALRVSNHVFNVKHLVGELPAIKAPQKRHILARLTGLRTQPGKLLDYAARKIPYRLWRLKPADFILAGGCETVCFEYPNSTASRIIWCHALDYDSYLALERQGAGPCRRSGDYAVFLDQYVPFHSDYLYNKNSPRYDPDAYYSTLLKYFAAFEKQTGLHVKIAAHPRSKYEERGDLFQGREVTRGKTAELVRDATIVLLHGSVALNFAVLYRKPVIFITLDMFKETRLGSLTNEAAHRLGKSPINISEPHEMDFEGEFRFDPSKYERYQDAFIKTKNTPREFAFHILADHLKYLRN
jgi:hypothetical protein